jgi:Protein of unknown function (DUF1800)
MATTLNPSCNTATLSPYIPSPQNPWDVSKIKHAYRRIGFGASIATVDDGLALTPGQFIDSLVDGAAALPATPAPFWGSYTFSNFTDFTPENEQYIFDWRLQSGNDIISEKLRGRLAFFWMNHFVTELETVFYAPYVYQYYNKMQSFALGNFREFTRAIGTDNFMLLYLNGFENTNNNPNENYARELFELFTLGEGNGYTQQDILETSRALTGYNHWVEFGGDIYFDSSTHDAGLKTIFGQQGTWDYDDVIDILFQQKGALIANFICEKLYKYFVSPSVDAVIRQDIIQPLAQTLLNADFEMVPMLKQLFKSEHFFDERAVGVVIKSPLDLVFTYINEASFYYDDTLMEAFLYYAGLIGQEIYDPPDVSGWQRDESWINSSTLAGRWGLIELYIDYLFINGQEHLFVDLARELSNDSNDPAFITEVVINHFMSKALHTVSDYEVATVIFKWEVPQNYYDTGTWNLSWTSAPLQVSLLLKHIAQMPEFQLK